MPAKKKIAGGAPPPIFDAARDAMVAVLSSSNPSTPAARNKICASLSKAVSKFTTEYEEIGFAPAEATSSTRLALENAFSFHVRDLAKQGNYGGLPGLLDLVLQAATSDVCATKTPFVMLEDLLEATTLNDCKRVWDLIEERRDVLCDTKFVPEDIKRNTKSKLALLRIANRLLRRLSHNNDTEFCGRIVMFLAYVYPLNERSGVNLKGDVNTSNTTEYEEEIDFVVDDEEDDGAEDSTSSVSSSVSSSSTSTASSTASTASSSLDTSDDQTATIDYNLYRRFWDVQRYASNPHLAYTDLNHWKEFCTNVDTMLGAFEGHALSTDQQVQQQSTAATATSASSTSTTEAGGGGGGGGGGANRKPGTGRLTQEHKPPRFN